MYKKPLLWTEWIKNGEVEAVVQVKLFDCEHEKDLEEEMNEFLSRLGEREIIDVKYHVAAIGEAGAEQVYCFSAMVLYVT